MVPKIQYIYQFKITLAGVKPVVWRRIQVPGKYNFWELHVAIQDAMGWTDCHLHEFMILNPKTMIQMRIGIPSDDYEWSRTTKPDWETPIAKYFTLENRNAVYVYDFGDGWKHNIRLEEIEPRQPGLSYPRCLDGDRACPPEDVGGPPGYEHFLKVIKDPNDEEHDQLLNWIGGSFDPKHFDPQEVVFDDPVERFDNTFEED